MRLHDSTGEIEDDVKHFEVDCPIPWSLEFSLDLASTWENAFTVMYKFYSFTSTW